MAYSAGKRRPSARTFHLGGPELGEELVQSLTHQLMHEQNAYIPLFVFTFEDICTQLE